ncbi:MAG TPA: DUF3343 domain-containing protein [Acidobacteriota bacterium]|nr:DUF3343 domain-containing protein [Acidobacteriota bacterium]
MPDTVCVYGIVLFHTSSSAIRAEKILVNRGLPVKLIPTPREFSSDCGVALRFDWQEETRVRELLESSKVETASIRAMDPG